VSLVAIRNILRTGKDFFENCSVLVPRLVQYDVKLDLYEHCTGKVASWVWIRMIKQDNYCDINMT